MINSLRPLEDLFEMAFLIRAVEQRLLELFKEGRLNGTIHTCIGQEWTGIAVTQALREGDVIFSNHRCHGHFLAWTNNVEGLISEIMGRETGVCGGKGGSQHICSHSFYSNGIQGGIMPVAAGAALYHKLKKKNDNIAVVFIGDGTLGEGVVYETLNIASLWGLPLFIVLENNLYAQSTPQSQALAGTIGARARAFNVETARANTWNPDELIQICRQSVESVRNNSCPLFLQVDTYRLMAHSKGDDERSREEIQEYWKRDTLELFRISHPEKVREYTARINERLDSAVARAESSRPTQPNRSLFTINASDSPPVLWKKQSVFSDERVGTRIFDALFHALATDDRVFLFGEDIEAPYGGAFKITRNLSSKFPGRVLNTPISEAAIVGIGNGLALCGYLPVCEIMFGDFLTLTMDQFLNHAAKFRYMYNDQVSVPIVVRTPMGGKRGYGPTHSQSLEKHFLGIPDTCILAINHRLDPFDLYSMLFSTINCPTLVIENKLLYGMRMNLAVPEGYTLEFSDGMYPVIRLRPTAVPDVTVICYGGMLADIEKALKPLFYEYEITCDVFCLSQLYPLNLDFVMDSVSRTKILVVIEEGLSFAALGSEIIAQITEKTLGGFTLRASRLGATPHPIPSCSQLEKDCLPGPDAITAKILQICRTL